MTSNIEPIKQIRERTDIVELVEQYTELHKVGKSYKGISPLKEQRIPCFHVWPETQTWRDFGTGAGGDVFQFIQQIENVDFADSVRLLAQRKGITIAPREDDDHGV